MEQHSNTAMIEAPDLVVASDNNIIVFPRHRQDDEPRSYEDVNAILTEVRTELCEQIADEQLEAVFAIARNYGVHTKPDRVHEEDYYFLRELIVAINLRYYGIHHEFQRIPDEAITFTIKATDTDEAKDSIDVSDLVEGTDDLKE